MRFFKKIAITSILTISLLGIACIHTKVEAANPDAFIVEVVPSSFDVHEAVDLTIKAVKADGEVISDYVGDVFIEIEGIVDTADYTVPSDGLYSFQIVDQWKKLFSKWLAIKKSWTFSVKVSDIFQDHIVGQRTVIVGQKESAEEKANINIISPIEGGIEKNYVINVMGNVSAIPNAPYEVLVNNTNVAQGTTTHNGDISAYLNNIKEGENVIQIKILNANNETIWESKIISFKYEPIKDGVFKSIKINPERQIKQWEKATFTVNTSESVTSVEIKLSDGKSIPMEKTKDGEFTKEIFMDTKGSIQIDVDLIVLGQTKSYTGVTNFAINEWIAIGKIRLYSDSIDKKKLNITREPIGDISQYKIEYGTSKNNLNLSEIVQTNEIIVENLGIGTVYYFQITPIDNAGNTIGTASDITEATIGETITCTVVGITISTGQIGEKYYLMRSGVDNVEKYIIYRSEFENTETKAMQHIGETTETMFEYPFNAFSKTNKYAYYTVEAVCKDGTNIKIDNTKKVKVGPKENIMLVILISLFAYTVYRLYGYTKS